MDQLSALKVLLQASIAKNGNQPLTLQHLVNLIGMLERQQEYQFAQERETEKDVANDLFGNGVH